MSNLTNFHAYTRQLYKHSPQQFCLSAALIILNTFVGGIGLFCLIPLLHYAGWLHSPTANADLFSRITQHLPAIPGQLPIFATLCCFVAIISLFASINYFSSDVQNRLMQNFMHDLRMHFNSTIANTKWQYLLQQQLKRVEYMLSTGLQQIATLTFLSLSLLSDTIVVIAYLAFALLLSPLLTLISILCASGILFFLRKNKAQLTGQQTLRLNQKMLIESANFLKGIKITKSHHRVDAYLQHYRQLSNSSRTIQMHFNRNQRLISIGFKISGAIMFAIIFYCAFILLKVSMVTILALLAVYSRLFARVSSLQQSLMRVLNIVPIFSELLQMQQNFSEHCEQTSQIQPSPIHFQSITLQNITFSHTHTFSLQNIHLRIQANTTTAIVGQSGAGKSTLVDILLGLLQPQSGQLLIDNQPLNNDLLPTWRSHISYVPQETFLFNDSIRANLLWAKPDASDKQIYEALSQAAAHFVEHLPNKLDSIIGDQGIHLSGGERQRLSLARALLRNPSILILDEATSALDTINEELILKTLQKLHGKLTVILIAHRYSTVRAADQVIVMRQGKVVEVGKQTDLKNYPASQFHQLYSDPQI